ncbi:MAG TPA: LysE family transporter [Actinocrinis sp.]|nr:LysE family transporter [Actinocrinis sp.]
MIGALLAGALAGYGVAIPVGAVGAYLVTLSARTSLRIGAGAALGIATADVVYSAIAMLGGTTLARTIQPAMQPLRWTSGLVLIALAARGAANGVRQYRSRATTDIATSTSTSTSTDPTAPTNSATIGRRTPTTPLRAYLSLWAVTMLNPLTVIYFAALVFGGQAKAASNGLDQVVFVAAVFVASASWQLLLAGGGALLGRVLTGDRGRLGTALASSLLIFVLAVRLLPPAL